LHLKKFLDFFLFSSLFISACSLLMFYFTVQAFALVVPAASYLFVFSGTFSSYNFHWFFTKTTDHEVSDAAKWSHRNKNLHLAFFSAGITGSIFVFIKLIHLWPFLLFTAFITFLYSAPKLHFFRFLKKLALAKTAFLALVWTLVTCILPFVFAESEIDNNGIIYIVGRFFFIYAICILFDERDIEKDREEGIRSMITYYDKAGIKRILWSSVLVSFLTISILLFFDFSMIYVSLLLFPYPVFILFYTMWFKPNSDYHFYFILDGLMMLHGLLLLLLRI
jgi:4-hydroxybenzoate polyprenyltransferase